MFIQVETLLDNHILINLKNIVYIEYNIEPICCTVYFLGTCDPIEIKKTRSEMISIIEDYNNLEYK